MAIANTTSPAREVANMIDDDAVCAATCTCDTDRLAAENEELRQVITMLRLALNNLNDAVGVLTTPTIPNN